LPTLADDSGLEVDALGGAPGVHSARFAGDQPNDADNRRLLLSELAANPDASRCARFVAVIAYIDERGHLECVRGTCEGRIALEERGTGGFGYDSLFEISDGRTMAQLSPTEKNAVSHRGHALRQILPILLLSLGVATPEGSVISS
jgi:XTP/dITP diphosphohydrolase